MNKKKVLILIGSDSDLTAMDEVAGALKHLGVPYELHIASAHRSPQKVLDLSAEARNRNCGVIICGAGMSAHLAGIVAAHTTLPVIGVPLASGTLGGIDALLSTAQMPPGIPVATMGIGNAGAFNAGLLAGAILAITDKKLEKRLEEFRKEMTQKVEQKDAKLQRRK